MEMKMEMEKCRKVRWGDLKEDGKCESFSSLSDSNTSSSSSSLLAQDDDDEATSSSTSSSSSSPTLFEFSDLMEQLPIKRGLSKYYNGKSESFASLTSVGSVEDLAKKESLYSKKMKPCKSYGSNLNNRHSLSPKATISKRSSPKQTLTFSTKPTNINTMAVN